MLSEVKWYLKQLFPLRYESVYSERVEDGSRRRRLTVWRMWFGRSFSVRSWTLA